MLWLHNVLRQSARGLAAGSVGLLLNGKAEPFGMKFDGVEATVLATVLFIAGVLVGRMQDWLEKRANL
jgi:hypothetical protein